MRNVSDVNIIKNTGTITNVIAPRVTVIKNEENVQRKEAPKRLPLLIYNKFPLQVKPGRKNILLYFIRNHTAAKCQTPVLIR